MSYMLVAMHGERAAVPLTQDDLELICDLLAQDVNDREERANTFERENLEIEAEHMRASARSVERLLNRLEVVM